MSTLDPAFKRTIARNLVRYAAGTAIQCPRCREILDAPATVVLSDATRTVVLCASCYGKPVGSFVAGSITVEDGRELFAARSTKRTWRFAS